MKNKTLLLFGLLLIINSCKIRSEFKEKKIFTVDRIMISSRDTNEEVTMQGGQTIKDIHKKLMRARHVQIIKARFRYDITFYQGDERITFAVSGQYMKSDNEWYKSRYDIAEMCEILINL